MSGSTRKALLLLVLEGLSVSITAMRFESLLKRDANTNATCLSQFTWANNGKGYSPCKVAAELIAPCHGGSWFVRDLPTEGSMYDLPTGSEAEVCTCSWAVYNLLSACSACQGIPQAVRPWSVFTKDCPQTALAREIYYPYDVPLPDDVRIPFWATTNPRDWKGATWNLDAARALYGSENASDVGIPPDPSTVETPQSSPTSSAGPIAGGVVGGVVVVLAAATLAFFLLKRHRRKVGRARGVAPSDAYSSTHYRSPSDATDKSGLSLGYTNLSSATGPSPGRANSVRTHNTSIHPFSTFGVPDQLTAPPPVVQSPPPPVAYSPPPVTTSPSPAHSRQTSDVITPFTLQHPVSEADRKTPLGSIPRYDSPNAPPPRAEDVLLETPQRGRMNPPAYSPHDTPSPPPIAPGPSRVHGKNGSVDTHRTNPSISGNNAFPQAHHLGRTASISEIVTNVPESVSGVPEGTTVTTTRTSATSAAYPRDIKRKPTDDSFTGRDLA